MTYAKFSNMYNYAIDALIDDGLTIKVDHRIWMDRCGNICSKEDAFGCKVYQKILRPDICTCCVELGGNRSMKRKVMGIYMV